MSAVVDRNRVFLLNERIISVPGGIIYWMTREQRIDDNWGLLHALELAEGRRDIDIVFTPAPVFSGHTERSFDFCIQGLREAESRARELGIGFRLLAGEDEPHVLVRSHAEQLGAAAVVCDFNPLRESLEQHKLLAEGLQIPVIEVDSRNVVPCRYISDKQEYGAFTLRKKIEPVLPVFLVQIPSPEDISRHRKTLAGPEGNPIDWEEVSRIFRPCTGIPPVKNLVPGFSGGMRRLSVFINEKLSDYAENRNDPNMEAQSGLSPWLRFGQISAQTAALRAAEVLGGLPLKGGFLDELIVRRELSDNFCLYNPFYDSFAGFPDWARLSLNLHSADRRDYLYSRAELERAETHDQLWNTAQKQMVKFGMMHGYMRMYWAKKILEWSPDAHEAVKRAVFLNDRYSLDGRDTNGYAGCAWAVGGLHDRAWAERPVFGKIRYMNERGCRRKFDVDAYIRSI